MKNILLISNRVMHYRVSIYNYFYKRFKEIDYNFIVRSNELQKSNKNPILFDFATIDFNFWKYKKEIERIRPDVIILFLHLKESLYWLLAHWLKINKIPMVYWNKAINYDDPDNRVRNVLFNYMHGLADAIILYSDKEKANIKKRNWAKLYFANNTINFNDFPPVSASKDEIKKEFGIPFDKVVLFTGRMETQGGRKKVDHLIQIFNEIDRQDVGLVIVGSGFPRDGESISNNKNIIYLGEVHDPENIKISKLFSMADVFSIPGHIGLGINQAMYYGLPVVTEKGGQPPEINYLVDGKTGFLVENNDIGGLKEKILYLLDNDQLRSEFSANARKHILSVASVENMYEAFEKACLKLTAKVNQCN